MSGTYRKEVFFNEIGRRWEYNIFAPNGDKCVYQDFNPTVCGAQPMTEEEANFFADQTIENITAPPPPPEDPTPPAPQE